MKSIYLIVGLLVAAPAFAQRTDTSRDARTGGVREGAVQRAQTAEDPKQNSELKKLGQATKTSTHQLKKELHAAQTARPDLTFDDFVSVKKLAFDEGLKVQDIVNTMKSTKPTDLKQAVESLKKTP
jgi:hypothetical protein